VRHQGPAGRQFSAAALDVQGRLRPLGIDAGPVDGFYGDQTRAAVQAFQQSHGLPASGDVDCATWQAMLALP
ncbi:MAG: peptidoglycan-binding protein, partial [Chloroflexales bacterium]|nr:peptidoglycan-binding protein [Chloroflexales bacterium]